MKQYHSISILLASTKRFSPPWLTFLLPIYDSCLCCIEEKVLSSLASPALPLVAASAALLATYFAIGCSLRCSPWLLPCHWLQLPLLSLPLLPRHWLQPSLVSLRPTLPLVAASGCSPCLLHCHWLQPPLSPLASAALPLVAASAALLASCLAIGCSLCCCPCLLPCHWLQPTLMSSPER